VGVGSWWSARFYSLVRLAGLRIIWKYCSIFELIVWNDRNGLVPNVRAWSSENSERTQMGITDSGSMKAWVLKRIKGDQGGYPQGKPCGC